VNLSRTALHTHTCHCHLGPRAQRSTRAPNRPLLPHIAPFSRERPQLTSLATCDNPRVSFEKKKKTRAILAAVESPAAAMARTKHPAARNSRPQPKKQLQFGRSPGLGPQQETGEPPIPLLPYERIRRLFDAEMLSSCSLLQAARVRRRHRCV
jgi:hypothetical protein